MALNDKESEAKKKPHEMPNAEFVSKLMGNLLQLSSATVILTIFHSFIAATPSYFFTPPQAGHNFFFSELLRSLVQKKKAEELNAAMKAKVMPKKIRKVPPVIQQFQKSPSEHEYKKPKLSEEVKVTESIENDQENSQDSVINVDKDDPPTTSTSTSTPSVPSLAQSAFYPYVDPLHFFIDLRVSAGQIYDRKKEAYLQQALKNNNILLDSGINPIIGRNRANSAFKVPISQNEQLHNFNAINLISNQQHSQTLSESITKFPKIYKSSRSDDDEPQENFQKHDEDVQIYDLDKSK